MHRLSPYYILKTRCHTIRKIPLRGDSIMTRMRIRLARISRERTLSKSQAAVFSKLADEGPLNAYQIAKKAGKRYSVVFNAIKELEKYRLVKLKAKERTIKGTMAKVYDLTLRGVLFALEVEMAPADTERWNYDLIHKIIRRYDSLLPLVFGKWSYFEKMGVGKTALFRVKMIADNQELFERGTVSFEDYVSPGLKTEQKIIWFFYFWGFYPARLEGWGGVADPKVWKHVWKQDEDIKAFVVEKFKEEQKRLQNRSIFLTKILSFLNGA